MSDTLTILSDALAGAVDHAAQSIVSVHARPRLPSTGVHWRDGLIVTTDGTVRRTEGLSITLPDGRNIPATLKGRDPGTDLAVLVIPAGLLPVAPLATTRLRPGHLVVAVGRIDDSGPWASFGTVTTTGGTWNTWKGGEIDWRLQSGLPIYPGMGGGPLIDVTGQVHGINSGGLSRPLATTIPVQTVDRVVTALLSSGYVARGYIGAALQTVRFSESARASMHLTRDGGLVVLEVDADGPAHRAGLLLGDVLLTANGASLETPEDLQGLLGPTMVGRTLKLELVRGGVLTSAELLVGERPRKRA